MNAKRAILDTNLWISFLISSKLEELAELLEAGKLRLIFSDELLEEFWRSLKDQNSASFLMNKT